MTLDPNFEEKKLSSEHFEEVAQLVTQHYTDDFFTSAYAETGGNQFLRSIVKTQLSQNWSLGVYEKSSNKLVGFVMNVVKQNQLEPNTKEFQSKELEIPSKIKAIQKFSVQLREGLLEHLKADKIFYGSLTAVHSDYRKHGIFSYLGKRSLTLASEAGCKYLVTQVANDFLAAKLKATGGLVYREMIFKDYDEKNGTNLFINAKYPYLSASLIYFTIGSHP